MNRVSKLLVPVLVLLLFTGCAGVKDITKDWSPERFYKEAKEKVASGDYETAIKYFEGLESRYPYGPYAEQAQLEIAYANYKWDEPALAIAAADRFLRLHPTHPNADYAYYLKGLVNFHGEKGFAAWLFNLNDDLTDRDSKGSIESYNAFRELVERYPNSRYTKDAKLRMAYLFNSQAIFETGVARFYYDRGAYVAAINRCKYALENYPRTPSTEDALGIMTLSYKATGLTNLTNDTLRILKKNFPSSRYIAQIETRVAKR